MKMKNFTLQLKKHMKHVKTVGIHCKTEEITKQTLILPFLDILGFNAYILQNVRAEYRAGFSGMKLGGHIDYILFYQDAPVMFIEAKAYKEKIDNCCSELARYFNHAPDVKISAITNGQEWHFFTDLQEKGRMDPAPFLRINMDDITDSDARQLFRFRHDKFEPEALRTLAEENVYIALFSQVLRSSLQGVDTDFVRYVAARANIDRPLNQRFIDTMTPLVREAVQRTISAMVISGVSAGDLTPESTNIVMPHNEHLLFDRIVSILERKRYPT